MTTILENAYQVYTDLNGDPLDNGYVYVGVANMDPQTNPITVYWDAAGTVPASQPLRTQNGYIVNSGAPAVAYLTALSYSVEVFDAGMGTVYSATEVNTGVVGYAPLASPHFTGIPTAPTGTPGASTTQIANQAWVLGEIAGSGSIGIDTVANVAALRAATTGATTTMATRGYYVTNDGGGATYYFDAADTTSADNGGTVIVTADSKRFKLRVDGYVNVRQFGAKGDSTHDDVTNIQAAMNAVSGAGGGTVFLPRGEYNVSAALVIASSVGISLLGDGQEASSIRSTSATASILTISGWYVRIDKLGFNASVARTAGAYVDMQGNFITISNFRMENDFTGIKMAGVGCRILNGVLGTGASGGRRIWATGGDTSQIIDNVLIGAQNPPYPSDGIYVDSSSALMITNTSVITQGNCLHINAGNGQGVFSLWVDNCGFDNSTNGILIETSGTGVVSRCRFANSWASSMSANGVSLIQSGGGSVSSIHFESMHMCLNALSGLAINTATIFDVSVNGGQINGNTQHGVYVAANVSDFQILDAAIGTAASGGANGGYGVYVSTGSSDRYLIALNRFNGNTGGTVFDGGTGTNKTVMNNYVLAGGGSGMNQLTGDVLAGPGAGSQVANLSTTGVTSGSYGSTNNIATFTVNNKGRLSAASTTAVVVNLTGDGSGSLSGTTLSMTLANSGVSAGTYGTLSQFPVITVDAKGRITSVSQNIVQAYTIKGLVGIKVTTGGGGTVAVSFAAYGFTAAPAVVGTAEAVAGAVVYIVEISSVTTSGCTVTVVNAAGTGLAGIGVWLVAIGPT